MSTHVLGISGFYHDSAAAIVRDGEIVAAAQEERFTRRKHDPRFPVNAVNYCLEEAFIEADELDAVVFYDNPLLTLDRVVKNCLTAGTAGIPQFKRAARSVLGHKIWVDEHVRRAMGSLGKENRLFVTEHHMAHAASAFYPSPFETAAIVTLDGVGEWATTTIGLGDGDRIELLEEIEYPHSLGLLYSAFTYYCGFKVNSGEYKLMGLAPYGEPRYCREIREHLIDLRPDGSYRLNLDYFNYMAGETMTNERFDDLFGGPPRDPEARITRREMDVAASIQKVTEEAVLGIARHAREKTGARHVCLAGGVALNCVANGKLLRERLFDGLWVQPAAGDAGGALGAALLGSVQHCGVSRRTGAAGQDVQSGSYLGPSFSEAEIRAFLERYDYPHELVSDPAERASRIAGALADQKIVGYFGGRMEFGPRALGARSIIGDPRSAQTQEVMNLKIKYRESFRPFAPSVAAECAADYFDIEGESPYMLLVAPVREGRRKPFDLERMRDAGGDLLPIVREPRSDIPAVTHVDYSARVQTVTAESNPDYYAIIDAFRKLTGCAVIVNTSFNVRGEPIVCTPDDAYACFMNTEMDVLVLGPFILTKDGQPPVRKRAQFDEWHKGERVETASPTVEEFIPTHLAPLLNEVAESIASAEFPHRSEQQTEGLFIARKDSATELSGRKPIEPFVSDQLGDALEQQWRTQGREDLMAIARPLAQLASRLRTDEPRNVDVSPLMYEMF